MRKSEPSAGSKPADPPRRFGSSGRLGRSISLAQEAAEAIVVGVASGDFAPGERIVETELAKRLNMSRVPLREGLNVLRAQGILENAAGRGLCVAHFDAKQIAQVCDARVALELIAVREAAETYRTDPGAIAGLDAVIETMREAGQRLDWMGLCEADMEFHREICRASGNHIVETLWEAISRHVMIIFGLQRHNLRHVDLVIADHALLRDHIVHRDLEALRMETKRHIRVMLRPRGEAVAGGTSPGSAIERG